MRQHNIQSGGLQRKLAVLSTQPQGGRIQIAGNYTQVRLSIWLETTCGFNWIYNDYIQFYYSDASVLSLYTETQFLEHIPLLKKHTWKHL